MRAVATTLHDKPTDPVAYTASLLLAPSLSTAAPTPRGTSGSQSTADDDTSDWCACLEGPLSRALNTVVQARPVPPDPATLVGALLLSGGL